MQEASGFPKWSFMAVPKVRGNGRISWRIPPATRSGAGFSQKGSRSALPAGGEPRRRIRKAREPQPHPL
ncbi:hypothetical protein, partial [Paenibacillus tuaregi]|uniref:hypothetical protein n=1 Tax=Paenibacillus tuaregi TaxID=1816681 RepID=UPI001951F997